MKGWERRESLERAEVESRKAFMAMEFNDEMDCVFKDCFKPAVEAAGFKLPDLREGQPAGLIGNPTASSLANLTLRDCRPHAWHQWRLLGGGICRRFGPPRHLHLPQTGVGRQQVAFRYQPPEHDHLGPGKFAGCRNTLDCDNPGNPARRMTD